MHMHNAQPWMYHLKMVHSNQVTDFMVNFVMQESENLQ